MMQRYFFALALVFAAAFSNAQERSSASKASAHERTLIGFRMGDYLRSADPEEMINLFLEGSTTEVDRIVREHGGMVKMKMRNWTSVRMPAGRVQELNNEPAVRSIQGFAYGQTLNDSMRVKTHMDWVQQGLAPLQRAYDGKGVVIGTVDTGMDLNHPDFAGRNITSYSFVPNEAVQDMHGHGTHCIGTSCGNVDNLGQRSFRSGWRA